MSKLDIGVGEEFPLDQSQPQGRGERHHGQKSLDDGIERHDGSG